MKPSVFVLLLVIPFSLCAAQTPSASPESSMIRNFGQSLEKYDDQKRKKITNKQKQKETQTDDEVIRVETDLVVHDVLVTDPEGNVITSLNKGDFMVIDDGVPQNIEIFSSGTRPTIPRSIVLVIDISLPQFQYLKMSVEAAKLLVDKLESQDRMAVVTTDLVLVQDYTGDKSLLKKTLDYVEIKGRELSVWYARGAKLEDMKNFKSVEEASKAERGGQFGALTAVLNEKFDEKGRQRIIVFQGDGIHMIWLKPDKELPYPVSHITRMNSGMKYTGPEQAMLKFGFSDVREAIESARATIYSVATGMRFFGLSEKERVERAKISWENTQKAHGWKSDYTPEQKRMYVDREDKNRTAGQAAMYRVAELSGGNTAVMEKPEDAERIYSDIFAVIKNRYVLGYYPPAQAATENAER